jgi:hypothetical protein
MLTTRQAYLVTRRASVELAWRTSAINQAKREGQTRHGAVGRLEEGIIALVTFLGVGLCCENWCTFPAEHESVLTRDAGTTSVIGGALSPSGGAE